MALELEAAVYIQRVPTKVNIADDPSQEIYDLLHKKIGVCVDLHRHCFITHVVRLAEAKNAEAVLYKLFQEAQSWSSLSITARKVWNTDAKAS